MQCVILAGGFGTRLGSLTARVPKALVPVAGKPFIDYQLRLLAEQSVDDVVISVGHRGAQLVDHVADGARFGTSVRFVDEGRDLKGTAGALRLALDAGVLAGSFYVLYGDSFLPIAFAPVYETFLRLGLPALMTVFRNEDRWDRSNVSLAPPLVRLYDKRPDRTRDAGMTHIDYGLSVLSAKVVRERVPAGTAMDLAEVFTQLSLDRQLGAYEVAERFYEIGSATGLADFCDYVVKEGRQLPLNE